MSAGDVVEFARKVICINETVKHYRTKEVVREDRKIINKRKNEQIATFVKSFKSYIIGNIVVVYFKVAVNVEMARNLWEFFALIFIIIKIIFHTFSTYKIELPTIRAFMHANKILIASSLSVQ